MPYLNRVMLIGVIAREPEYDSVPSGITVANLRLAVKDVQKDKGGNRIEHVHYVNINVWDKLADLCRKMLRKGSLIMVDGRLKTNEWISKEGDKRQRLIVHAERIEFLERAIRSPHQGDYPDQQRPYEAGGQRQGYQQPRPSAEDEFGPLSSGPNDTANNDEQPF